MADSPETIKATDVPPKIARGSTLAYTENLRHQLPGLLRRHNVATLLDAACGPFTWLAETALDGVSYIGLDRNRGLIAANTQAFAGPERSFEALDVIHDVLPAGDLLLCRDLLNHLAYLDIYRFLGRFLASDSPWLLTGSHALHNNADLAEGRRWRQLNLTRPPFNFPEPVERIEDWIEGHPRRDLCLWSRQQVALAMSAAPLGFQSQHTKPPEPAEALPVPVEALQDSAVEFVTVVYRPELMLLRLQARSMRQHMAHADIRRIHVIVNEDDPKEVLDALRDFAEGEYGPLADRLRLWTAEELLPGIRARGWRKQQTLKLAIATRLSGPRYIVMDAKNHFIRGADHTTFFAEDGRIRSFWSQHSGSMQNYLRNCLRYFDLPEEWCLARVMPATTPYGLYTDVVTAMMREIANREAMPFAEFFHAPGRNVTEFFLYFCHLRASGVDPERLYAFGRRYAVTLFARWPETHEQEMKVWERLRDPRITLFGLHRARLAKLDEAGRAWLFELWVEARLFSAPAEAAAFFTRMLEEAALPP